MIMLSSILIEKECDYMDSVPRKLFNKNTKYGVHMTPIRKVSDNNDKYI